MHLLSLFKRKAEEGMLLDLVDNRNDEMQIHGAEVLEMMKVAVCFLQGYFTKRPSMSVLVILWMLETTWIITSPISRYQEQ